MKRLCRLMVLGLGCAFGALAAHAEEYPAKPIRLIVPFATGGVTDTSARLLADRLTRQMGHQVMVENRPGASGNLGTYQAAQAYLKSGRPVGIGVSAPQRVASLPDVPTFIEQFTEQIRADLARWSKVVEQAKIRLE